ncbi:MAG: hypothetical protein ABI972_09995 [Acidobacteriota bacterium]
MLRWIVPFVCQLPASAALICFYGADLDQVHAKDFAKDIAGLYKAANPDAKTGVGTNIKATEMFGDLKAKLAGCYDEATKQFKCDGGILLFYFSADGNETPDGKDTIVDNTGNSAPIKVSELAASLAATIPDCCTLIFAFDSCFADRWYDNYIEAEGEGINPNNPFKNINHLVLTPKVQPDGKCLGSPVGDALTKAFKNKTPQTIVEFAEFMGKEPNVRPRSGLDETHEKYKLIAEADIPSDPNDPVPVPEPAATWLAGAALVLMAGRISRAAT